MLHGLIDIIYRNKFEILCMNKHAQTCVLEMFIKHTNYICSLVLVTKIGKAIKCSFVAVKRTSSTIPTFVKFVSDL